MKASTARAIRWLGRRDYNPFERNLLSYVRGICDGVNIDSKAKVVTVDQIGETSAEDLFGCLDKYKDDPLGEKSGLKSVAKPSKGKKVKAKAMCA